MLVYPDKYLKDAKKNNYAIPSVNFIDNETARSYTKIAEKLNVPIFLSYAQSHEEIISLEEAAVIGKFYAEKVNAPIILHLDHGQDFETVKKAIDLGFTSVMIDASMEEFENNIAITKKVVDFAHQNGVFVEAELGHVGSNDFSESEKLSNSVYTETSDVKKFIEKTNTDSLAISIGTAHGLYKGVPKINFDRLHEIARSVDTPLVLHGGSSSGDENLNRCATEGISKINIYSDFINSSLKIIKNNDFDDYIKYKNSINNGYEEVISHYIHVFETKKYNGGQNEK